MNKLLAAIGALAVLGSPALAADLPVKAVYKAPLVAVWNWTGCYVGVNAGGAFARSDWVSTSGVNSHPKGDNGVIGGHIGCNYQFAPSFVVGIEGDVISRVRGNGNWSTPGFTSPFEAKAVGSVRGRAGFAFDQVLLYATGGVAFANWSYATPECGPAACSGFSNQRTGYVVGGGLEYMFTRNFSGRVEGLYYDFGTIRSIGGPGGVDTVPTDIRTRFTTIRAGLTYHFGGPVVARY